MSADQQDNLIKNLKNEKISFTKGSWIRIVITVVILIALFIIWHSLQVILAIFAGILLAIFLHWLSVVLSLHLPLTRKWALFIVIGLLALLIILLVYFGAPYLIEQFTQLGQQFQESWRSVRSQLSRSTIGQFILNQIPSSQEFNNGTGTITNNLYSRLSRIFSGTFDFVANIIIIIFVGIYLAYEPGLYVDGLTKLAPLQYRSRLRQMFHEIVFSLRWWLVGQFVTMVIIGVLATAGLMLVGVPLAIPLGLLASLLEFVPILGSITASVGPILIALAISPQMALYVVVLFLVIQLLEGNVITPII